jgi:hypothetical protein
MHVSLSPCWSQQNFKTVYFVVRYPVLYDLLLGKFFATQRITVYKKSPLFGIVFKFLPYSILFQLQNSFRIYSCQTTRSYFPSYCHNILVIFQYVANIDVQFIRAVSLLFYLHFIAKLFMNFNPIPLDTDVVESLSSWNVVLSHHITRYSHTLTQIHIGPQNSCRWPLCKSANVDIAVENIAEAYWQ